MRAILLLTLFGLAITNEAKCETPEPTHADVAYGEHDRHRLDVWLAKSDEPTPLIVYIHGGGFIGGDKSHIQKGKAWTWALEQGVSVASINYRFRQHAPIQDILRDGARAVQYLRTRAEEWNIDPERIAAYGGSAGAGTSLWLAFHDDLADPKASDPVLRQSSRICAAGSLNGQATYDVRRWDAIVGPPPFQTIDRERLGFYHFHNPKQFESKDGDAIMRDCSMVDLITKDDPPVMVACTAPSGEIKDRGHYLHHPSHSEAIANRCREMGVSCRLILREDSEIKPSQQGPETIRFLVHQLKETP